jgi:hypothetical protein
VKSTTYTLTPTLSLKGEGVYGWALAKIEYCVPVLFDLATDTRRYVQTTKKGNRKNNGFPVPFQGVHF